MFTTISRQISIKPIELNENIKHTIIEKLKDTIEKDDCSYENGYILSINKILSYTSNYISNATNMVVFTVVFDAVTLNPNIGSIYEGKVISIHSSGFFVEIKNKIKVLIVIVNNNTESIPTKDSIVKIEITDIRYQNKKISCIGKLKT
jgi:DNA-directed RNA polymerase subunit E'/Rpb7